MAWQNILRECILKLDTCTVIISVQDCNHWFNKCIGARSEPINANFFINKKKKIQGKHRSHSYFSKPTKLSFNSLTEKCR